MNAPTTRAVAAAMLRAAYPAAPADEIEAVLDRLAGPRGPLTTADRLAPPAPASPPAPTASQVAVEVIEAAEREWPDSGLVLSLTLRRLDDFDAEPIKARFDQGRAVARQIAEKALGGLADGEPVTALVGRQAVVETRPYQTRDGEQRVGVAKWIVPRKHRRPAAAAPLAVKPRKPEIDQEDDDIAF
jgi:hypothetical protein